MRKEWQKAGLSQRRQIPHRPVGHCNGGFCSFGETLFGLGWAWIWLGLGLNFLENWKLAWGDGTRPLCAAMEELALDLTPQQSCVADTDLPGCHPGVLAAS